MSRLLILQLLGPFAATYHGTPLSHFRTRTVQALLVYLTCQPEAHQREGLMALLWPDATRASAQNSLRQALYHLRQAVPEVTAREGTGRAPFILSSRQTVRVNPEATFDLDVATFEKRLKGTQAQWQEAVGLYRGDFLCDFYLPDSAQFEEWVLARRAELRRQVMDTLDLLIASQMEQGAYESAEAFSRRQLAIDNLHELAHRRLIEVLVHLGRRTQALSHYETYCRLLDDELGVGPTEECLAIIEQVRGGAPFPSAPAPAAPPPRPVRKHNLRPQPTRLIGREQELSELGTLAADPFRRLITIVGPGGIGKTRLALAFAEKQLEEKDATDRPSFADGVFFVPLQPHRNRDQIIVAIAKAMDLPLDGTEERSLQQQLLDFLREKQLLLILDSFEHLLNAAPLLAEMLAVAPGLRLLVTSRTQLGLYGEQAYPLLGLAFPVETATRGSEDLLGYASVALFLERARRILPGYTPSLDGTFHIAELCRLVSGAPLALEMAASRIDTLSPSQIATEIRRNLDFLTVELRDVPERHQSMRAVFDSTWSQLSAAERGALAQLSVFRGDFGVQAAMAVAGTDRHTLTGLVHKSILQYDRERRRYHIHELLRQYGERRLSSQDSAANEQLPEYVVRNLHSAYYCRALGDWEKGLKSERQREVLAEIGNEEENVRAAWEWAATNSQAALMDQAAEGLAVYIACQGHHKFGVYLFDIAAQAMRKMPVSTTPRANRDLLLYGRLLLWHAYFCDPYDDQCRREQLAEESLAILEDLQAQDVDTRLGRAQAWHLIATNHHNAWRHDEAFQAARKSLALSQAVEDDWCLAGALEVLGWAAHYFRRYQEAREWLESCLAVQRKLGNRAGEARALCGLASIAGSQGHFARSEQLMRAGLAIHEELGNQRATAQTLGSLATNLYHQGRYSEAVILLTEAITRSRHLGINSLVAYQLGVLAAAKESLGLYDEAAALAREVLALIREQNITLVRTLALRILCTVAIVRKRYGEASNLLQERQKLLVDSPLGLQIGLACQSYLATANQEYVLSARVLQAALEGSDQAANSLLWTLPAGALLLARLGVIRQALALYAAATHEPLVGNSRWFDDVVGAPLREMARALPPETVQEIEEQGRTWDMWQARQIMLEQLEAAVGEYPPTDHGEADPLPSSPE